MTSIDDLLRKAKPPAPDLPDDFSSELMQRIEKEKITIRQSVVSEKSQKIRTFLGLGSLVLAIILFSYNSYELRMNGSLELLFFGTRYLGDFMNLLPWDLIIPSFLLTAFSIWMIKKANLVKRGLAVTAIISYLITGVGGAAIASTGLNEQIEAGISFKEKDWPWVTMFRHHRAMQFIQHPNFKMGRVEANFNGSARVVTPNGETITIKLPANTLVAEGQILRISGEGEEAVFTAQRVHICNPNRVMRYFGRMMGPGKMMKDHSCCTGKGMMRMMKR